jgi:predicted dehydrogenase
MDSPLRVALAGYGLAGRVFHAPLVAAAEGLALTHVATSAPERVAQARADIPAVRVLADGDALLAAAEEWDLLVVATTNTWHAPLATAALRAGKAVVVDKPLAPTAADAEPVLAAARETGSPLTVFQNRRWDAEYLTLRSLVEEGALGEVLRLETRFERWRPEPRADAWREHAPVGEGGGQLVDLGPHLVDQAVQLLGPVESVYAEVRSVRGAADDLAFLALRHRSGAATHVSLGAVIAAPGPRLRALGTAGAFVVDHLDGQEDALREGRRPGGEGWGVVPMERWGRLVHGDRAEPAPSERGSWDAFYPAVREAVAGRAPLPVDPADALEVLRILDAARLSAAQGTAVKL